MFGGGVLILVSDYNVVQGLPKCGPRTPELVLFHFNEHNIKSLQIFFLATLLAKKVFKKRNSSLFFNDCAQ
jgi:hypothetical protein